MNSNFCDRCGCQLKEDNFDRDGGKYRIDKRYFGDLKTDLHGYYKSLGRGLFFCNNCQKAIDKKLDDEFTKLIPDTLEIDLKYVKEHADD